MFEQLQGLVVSPRALTLYVDRTQTEDGSVFGWHLYDKKSDKRIYISKPAVQGQLTGIRMNIQEFQQKQAYKISFIMTCGDRVWRIKSGVDTIFSRGIVLALKMIENLGQLPTLTILTEPGDTTVYGSIWIGGEQLWPERDDDIKLFPIVQELQKIIGCEVQTPESIKADFENFKR